MSHELEVVDGRAMFLGRKPAWHQLGQVVGDNFGVTEIERQAPEILMPVWKVVPWYQHAGAGVTVPGTKVGILRADGKVVGEGLGADSYGIVQARDAFDFGQELAQVGDLPLESAGTIREGSQFFFTYRSGEVGTDDVKCNTHVSIVSSHDGSLPLMALYSTTIVVCANTLAMAMSDASDRYTLRHTVFVEDRMQAILQTLEGDAEYRKAQGQALVDLGLRRITVRDFDVLLDGLLPTIDHEGRSATQREAAREAVRTLYKAPVVGNMNGTALGWVQAVNTYENWNAPVRGRKGQSEATLRAVRQFDAVTKGVQPLTRQALQLVAA